MCTLRLYRLYNAATPPLLPSIFNLQFSAVNSCIFPSTLVSYILYFCCVNSARRPMFSASPSCWHKVGARGRLLQPTSHAAAEQLCHFARWAQLLDGRRSETLKAQCLWTRSVLPRSVNSAGRKRATCVVAASAHVSSAGRVVGRMNFSLIHDKNMFMFQELFGF